MNAMIERSQRFLDGSLGAAPRVLLLVGAVLLFPIGLPPASGVEATASASWVPFALGALALLFLRTCVHGKVRDLVDIAVIALYFGLFLLWSSPLGSSFYRLLTVTLLTGAALVLAWHRAVLEDVAAIQSAG